MVGHSLYKAHAFLSSGGAVRAHARRRERRSTTSWPVRLGALGAAGALTWGLGTLFGIGDFHQPQGALFGVIFSLGLTSLLWNLWATEPAGPGLVGRGLLLAGGTAAGYFAAHGAFGTILAASFPRYAPVRSPGEFGIMAFVTLLFTALLVLQWQWPVWASTKAGRALYVHASHGFYLGTFANRLTLASMRPRATGNASGLPA